MSLPSDNPVLDARGLVYPADGSVLQQVSLAVGASETVAVLGPAGAGKSVLMACLSGERDAAGGSVWINGKPVHLQSTAQKYAFRLKHHGLVHQDAVLVAELTLAQNTALPLLFRGIRPPEAERRAHTWLERFELGTHAHLRPGELPVPIARRGALARAMVNEPLVLLADEPFDGMSDSDIDHAGRVLQSVAHSHGTAIVVFTAHETAAKQCDRTVHLKEGRTSAEPLPSSTKTVGSRR
ncbi:MAG TPA: ATP-binding cassette domain-containing protein [Actinocrinis sp.]